MKRRIAGLMLSLTVGALALPIAPGLLQSAAAVTPCPAPGQNLLINPIVTSLPNGTPVAHGGSTLCVSLGSGAIGASPLPPCPAPGVLAVVGATVVDTTVTQGVVECVTLASATSTAGGQVFGAAGLLTGILTLLQNLLAGLGLPPIGVPGTPGLPGLPTLPGLPSLPGLGG